MVSVYFRADQESSPAKGNPCMDHLAIKSQPTSKHRDCSLYSQAVARTTRLREGQQLLQGLEEFPFLVGGCGKTAPGQKHSAWLGVFRSLQDIIIELWIYLTQHKTSADLTQRETTRCAKMPLGTPTRAVRLQNPDIYPAPSTQNPSAANLQIQFDLSEVSAALCPSASEADWANPFSSANPPGPNVCIQVMCSLVVLSGDYWPDAFAPW